MLENRLCGCGVPFRGCPVWGTIFDKAFGGIDQIDPRKMLSLIWKVRTRHFPLLSLPFGKRLLIPRLRDVSGWLQDLYLSIHSSTRNSVIVDSSKVPTYGYVVRLLPTIDLYVVHLVRDSRAVAYSFRRRKLELDTPGYLPQRSPVSVSMLWNGMNMGVEMLLKEFPRRYMLLRYEDFVQKPRESIVEILDFLGVEAPMLPFRADHQVTIEATHTVSGNPDRFRTGRIAIRLDDEWKTKMRRSDKAVVTALTWPLLVKYGYLGG